MADEYALLITKEGASVTSTNPLDFILNSLTTQTIKMHVKVQTSVVVNASATLTVTINHSLGFAPLAMIAVELKPGTGKFFFGTAGTYLGDADGGGLSVLDAYTTDTSLKIILTNEQATQKTIRFAYILYADNGR